jgi:hypothetical protein
VSTRSALAALLAGGLLVAGCAGTDPEPRAGGTSTSSPGSATTPSDAAPRSGSGQHLVVEVAGGQVTGDTGRVPVASGEHVTLAITSDVADEVHLHGYDLEAELSPGQPAELTFDATIPGVFEVELHEAGTLLLSLQVG